jgi:hypothetical protein
MQENSPITVEGSVPSRKRVPRGYMTRDMIEDLGLSMTEIRHLAGTRRLRMVKRWRTGQALYLETEVKKLLFELRDEGIRKPTKRFERRACIDDNKERIYYDEKEAIAIARLIESRKPITRAVTKLRMHPTVVDAITKDYAKLAGALVVPKKILDLIASLPLKGTFPIADAEELYLIIKQAVRPCSACKHRTSEICRRCAEKETRSAVAVASVKEEAASPAAPQSAAE